MFLKHFKSSVLAVTFLAGTLFSGAAQANDLEMMTSKGKVMIDLDEKNAPNHSGRLVTLAKQGFYDGIIFHRVIPGFMAQTGDPTGTGAGGSKLPDLKAEFSNAPFKRGTIGMARAQNPDSANSQFFIMFDDGPWLNGQYTVIGTVTSGMDVIDKINEGQPPAKPDSIISMKVIQ